MTSSTLITLIQCEECQNLFLSVDDMTLHSCCTKNEGNKESLPTENDDIQASSSSNDVDEMPASTPKMEWSESQIKTLFVGYTKHQSKFYEGKFRNREIWEFVAKDLVKNGVSVTGEQCYNKWKSMLKHYNKTKMNSKAGNIRRKCPYYDEMDEILNNADKNRLSKTVNNSCSENLNISSESVESETTISKQQNTSGALKRTKKIHQGRKEQQLSVYLMEYLKKREEIEKKILDEERKADEERQERFKRAEYIAERKLELLERLVKAFES